MTIIFSSHILSDVQDIADHIGILNHGQIVRVKTPQELQDEFQVGNAVEITVADNTKLPIKLESLPGVEKIIDNPPNKLIVRYSPTIELNIAINLLMKTLAEQQLAIRSIVYLRPSLEEVYIKFVGGHQE
jgi:ABC-2 type transport system ATP-binding protein